MKIDQCYLAACFKLVVLFKIIEYTVLFKMCERSLNSYCLQVMFKIQRKAQRGHYTRVLKSLLETLHKVTNTQTILRLKINFNRRIFLVNFQCNFGLI